MGTGACPRPFHLVVHVDGYRGGAEEKVAYIHVGDVDGPGKRQGAKNASGEASERPLGQSNSASETWFIFHEGLFIGLQVKVQSALVPA